MLDALVAFGSTFMLLQSYVGADSYPQGLSKVAEYASPLRYQVESITVQGKCFSGMRQVPCHMMAAGCKVHCLLKYMPVFPIFYGVALLAVGFVAYSNHHLDDRVDDTPKKGLKEICGFTTFLLALASIAGLAASGVGLTLLVKPMMHLASNDELNVFVGWGQLITMSLTVSLMFITLEYFNLSRQMLAAREGSVLLEDSEQAQPLLEKTEA